MHKFQKCIFFYLISIIDTYTVIECAGIFAHVFAYLHVNMCICNIVCLCTAVCYVYVHMCANVYIFGYMLYE